MSDGLRRDPAGAAGQRYDLVVIGGGITGACLLLEAARRGLRPLLLEQADYGHATSGNSLRILHGGLRYLQTLDLPRLRASVAERRWFSRGFPELVRPLPCLMPLYGPGLRRPAPMRAALALNDALSAGRNRGVAPSVRLPPGRVLSPAETLRVFPGARRAGLLGGALWHDVAMTSSERVMIEILRWAVAAGATALNYTRAVGLRATRGAVTGVEAVDLETGGELVFEAPVAVACAGPWAREVAGMLDGPIAVLPPLALAFNLLLDRPPVAPVAVAVTPDGGGRTYFVVPWKGRVLAGTEHLPWHGDGPAVPGPARIRGMLEALASAVPALGDVGPGDVVRVLAGLMPTDAPGGAEPSSRDRVVDHGLEGGVRGLYSVVGVKYTTARSLAERVLRRTGAGAGTGTERDGVHGPAVDRPQPVAAVRSERAVIGSAAWADIVGNEAVLHLDDLLLRRMEWPSDAPPAQDALADLARRRGWDAERRAQELERLRTAVAVATPSGTPTDAMSAPAPGAVSESAPGGGS